MDRAGRRHRSGADAVGDDVEDVVVGHLVLHVRRGQIKRTHRQNEAAVVTCSSKSSRSTIGGLETASAPHGQAQDRVNPPGRDMGIDKRLDLFRDSQKIQRWVAVEIGRHFIDEPQ